MLKEMIETMTTYGSLELPDYLKIAGIKMTSRRKADMVKALYDYLSNKENIINIWKCTIPKEKELISEFIRAGGTLEYREIKEIVSKYEINQEKMLFGYSGYGNGIQKYFYSDSKANLLFIKEKMPIEIYNILKEMVDPIEVKFLAENLDVDKYLCDEEDSALISIREDFEKELTSIIKLVNSNKLKVTQASQMPNKTAMIKINEALIHKDIFFDQDISEVRIIDNTTRIYGISKLLLESKILQSENGNLILGKMAEEFLTMNTVEKCKEILNAYIFAKDIDELKRIKELKVKTEYYGNYANCRNLILNYLEKVPIDKWINIEQLLRYIKKLDRNFLRKEVGTIYTYSDYERYYYPDQNYWEEEAGRFIEVVLMEYLTAIGMVDVLIKQDYTDYDIEYFKVTYFKLTSLGAHILGFNKDYKIEEIEDETGIIIQPNYEIMVPEGLMKDVHCINLDKFAEKLSEDTVSIYKISFKSMVMALDNDISIEEVIEYLKDASKNKIPENVLMSLNEWNERSKKIKIRKVTIVETDDKYLLEELKSYKEIKKDIAKELPYAFEINSKNANKVKRNIEKKNHFCILE
ncbi:helicase-associated domain-containing protein [Clostridium beijerinckii]|uniref:helicase-associated domain-containing protein n=1 Tax=Clostridium beijerinckii TaxID=1520 RepID=UPI00232BCFCB|nr:helicase-associated domain-containing protein [Clostridium beijerinckii]